MAKKMKKTMSMVLVLCMMVSMMAVPAFAATTESENTFVDENGNTNLVITIEKTDSYVNEDGAEVQVQETEVTTIVETPDGERVSGSYVIDGSEQSEETKAATGTLEVPTEEGESNTIVSGDPVGTETVVDGSKESGNYTTETVKEQGSITVETNEIEVKENFAEIDSDLDYTSADVTPDGTNDLIYETGSVAPEEYRPGEEAGSAIPDTEYEFQFAGTGNTSQFVPAVVFTEPMTAEEKVAEWGDYAYIKQGQTYWKTFLSWLNADYKATVAKDANGNYVTDEEGFILDINGDRILREEQTAKGPNGETYYLHRIDANGGGNNVEGWNDEGEWVVDLNGKAYGAVWASAQQFVLVDSKTGEVVTTYCADVSDPTEKEYGYNVENLEDATYYSEEEAARIRSIASVGYWGTEEGFGSLQEMKNKLVASGQFTEEELECMTDGVALTATQMAIWSCSNKMSGVKFINSHYASTIGSTETGYDEDGEVLNVTNVKYNVPEAKEDEVVLMFKIFNYLKNLEGTEVEKNTQETIINEDNFIESMDLTVVKKDDKHANNQDDDATNDAYVTDLTFALVVKPVEGNEDELVVEIVTGGKTYKGRIAGAAQDGEIQLYADDKGNYTFKDIVIVEGDQTFKITLSGVQNLKEGVYLYSSEVRDGETSQTMVGTAHGMREVNVSMSLEFNLNVEDEVIVKERVWHEEGVIADPADPAANFNLPGRPLDTIPEEEVPLADAPQTGDEAIIFAFLTVLAGISLMAMRVSEKKRKEEI